MKAILIWLLSAAVVFGQASGTVQVPDNLSVAGNFNGLAWQEYQTTSAPWRNQFGGALANCESGPVHALVLGDSTFMAWYGNSSPQIGPQNKNNLPPQRLAQALIQACGGRAFSGNGTVSAGNYLIGGILPLQGNAQGISDVWTVTSGYNYNANCGPYQNLGPATEGGTIAIGPGQSATLAAQTADHFYVYGATYTDSVAFTALVDNASQGTFQGTTSGSCGYYRQQVWSGTSGSHVLKIENTNGSGNVYLYAAEPTNGTNGIEVSNLAIGYSASAFINSASALGYATLAQNVGLIYYAYGVNDWGNNVPSTTFASNLATSIGALAAAFPKASIVIVNEHPVNADNVQNGNGETQSAFWNVATNFVQSGCGGVVGGCGLADLRHAWISVAQGVAQGWYNSYDHTHENDEGGVKEAEVLEAGAIVGPLNHPLQTGSGGSYPAAQVLYGNAGPATSSSGLVYSSNRLQLNDPSGSAANGVQLELNTTASGANAAIRVFANTESWILGTAPASNTPITNSAWIYDENNAAFRQIWDPAGNVCLGGAITAVSYCAGAAAALSSAAALSLNGSNAGLTLSAGSNTTSPAIQLNPGGGSEYWYEFALGSNFSSASLRNKFLIEATNGTVSDQQILLDSAGNGYWGGTQTDGNGTGAVLWTTSNGARIANGNTFSTLSACVSGLEGTVRPVTDSTTNTWGATITGGGSNHVLAYCDGTNWTVAAK